MKKTIIAALLCTALTGQTSAQTEVLEANDWIEVIPASLTTSGKAKVLSVDSEDGVCSVKIYDENLNEVLSKSFNLGSYTYKSWTETATVVPTGAKLSSNQPYLWLHYADGNIDLTSVKTSADLAEALNQYAGLSTESSEYYIGFTDIEGYICCRLNTASCYLEEWLGKQYPRYYVRLSEGHVYDVTNVSYEPLYNVDTAIWEQIGEPSENSNTIFLFGFDYKNFDEKEYVENIFASQTLFNDNDTWEFVVPVYTSQTIYSEPWQSDSDADGIILRRNASIDPRVSGCKVIDENGTDIPGLSFKALDEVWRMNEKTYLKGEYYGLPEYFSVLYTLDDAGNAIEAIKTVGTRRMTRVIGNAIDVNTYDESGNVLLTDMAGSTIGRQSTDGGTAVRFSTDNLPAGIYNVALQRNGRTIATEKVLVK